MPPETIPDDVLDDLVWQMTHPAAIVSMSKATLRILLEAYERQQESASVTERHGMRVVGSLESLVK